MNLQLHGKRALVTGSSKGIGEAIARSFAAEGAIVIIHGRNQQETEKIATSIVAQGGQAHSVTGDLTDDTAVEQLVEQAELSADAVDILVNNAGGAGDNESWEATSSFRNRLIGSTHPGAVA